jgi:hypothetical protein
VLSAAYGIAIVAGLLELQRLAKPEDLAAATGLYYVWRTSGFCSPRFLPCFRA